MYSLRFSVILFIFLALMGGTFVGIRHIDIKRAESKAITIKDQAAENSDFLNVYYFMLKDKNPQFYLEADTLNNIGNESILLKNPRGEAYSSDRLPVYYQSIDGKVDKQKEIFYLNQAAKVDYKSSQIKADHLTYYKKEDRFEAYENVESYTISEKNEDKVLVTSHQAFAWNTKKFARYIGSVHGQVIKKKAYEEGIEFKSDVAEADMAENVVTLIDNVWLKKGDMQGKSLKAEIFLENYNKKLKYYVLYDDVRLEQKVKNPDGTTLVRKGFCEKLDGIVATDEVIMTGAPKLLTGTDVITGNKITLKQRAKFIEVDDNKSSLIIKKGYN
jgi:lipopolysaccharide transport protein LptA